MTLTISKGGIRIVDDATKVSEYLLYHTGKVSVMVYSTSLHHELLVRYIPTRSVVHVTCMSHMLTLLSHYCYMPVPSVFI